MKLALFDFDGTISSKDSFLLFLWYYSKKRFLLTCICHLPEITLYLARRFPNQRLKEIFLHGVLKNQPLVELETAGERFCRTVAPRIIREKFWQRLSHHQQRRHSVVVVTATPRFILEPWCKQNQIEIIGSELQLTTTGRVTGKLAGRNCMGEEKVTRIREKLELSHYDVIYGYGDSLHDLPMLDLAHPEYRYYKPFR